MSLHRPEPIELDRNMDDHEPTSRRLAARERRERIRARERATRAPRFTPTQYERTVAR